MVWLKEGKTTLYGVTAVAIVLSLVSTWCSFGVPLVFVSFGAFIRLVRGVTLLYSSVCAWGARGGLDQCGRQGAVHACVRDLCVLAAGISF